MYYTAADRGTNPHDQWARWQPSLPTYGGIYEILVHVPNQYATTWQAPYIIVHNDGTSYAVIDQYGLNNQWVSIGTYLMTNGNYVSTHDATGEASTQRWLGVDAVKFVRRGTTYAPDIKQGTVGLIPFLSAATLVMRGLPCTYLMGMATSDVLGRL